MFSDGNVRKKEQAIAFLMVTFSFTHLDQKPCSENLCLHIVPYFTYSTISLFTNMPLSSIHPYISIVTSIFTQLHSPHIRHIFSTQLHTCTRLLYTATSFFTPLYFPHPTYFFLHVHLSCIHISLLYSCIYIALPTQLHLYILLSLSLHI